jgi:hypothetical protein
MSPKYFQYKKLLPESFPTNEHFLKLHKIISIFPRLQHIFHYLIPVEQAYSLHNFASKFSLFSLCVVNHMVMEKYELFYQSCIHVQCSYLTV